MGQYIIDQFTLLHFAVGIIAYFWAVPLWLTVILHVAFELVENTPIGMRFINDWFTLWPGGKPYADSVTNSLADTAATAIGWLVSWQADKLSSWKHLYP